LALGSKARVVDAWFQVLECDFSFEWNPGDATALQFGFADRFHWSEFVDAQQQGVNPWFVAVAKLALKCRRRQTLVWLEGFDVLQILEFPNPFDTSEGPDRDFPWSGIGSEQAQELRSQFARILVQESWVQPEFTVFDLKLTSSLNNAALANRECGLARLEGLNPIPSARESLT
jgi:hypothetical protein